MRDRPPGLPAPTVTPLTEGYWRAAAEGRLVVQRCAACGAHRHPPTGACYRCRSLEWSWDEVPGTGRVYTYTWADRPAHPDLAHLGVYNVAVVELDGTEGDPVRILTKVVDVERDALRVGLPVEVTFERVDDETALPIFAPAGRRE